MKPKQETVLLIQLRKDFLLTISRMRSLIRTPVGLNMSNSFNFLVIAIGHFTAKRRRSSAFLLKI